MLHVHAVTEAGEPLLAEVSKTASGIAHRGITAVAFHKRLAGDLPLSNSAEVEAGLGTFRTRDVFRRQRGEDALPKQTVGVLTLPPDGPVHVALLIRNSVVAQMSATPDQEELTFTISPATFLAKLATVRLRIVDRDGNPVPGAQVALNDAQTGVGGKKTGDDGRVTLEHLKPGRLDLEMHKGMLRTPPIQIDVPSGAELDLGDVVALRGTPIELDLGKFEGKGSVRFNWIEALPPSRTCDEMYARAEPDRPIELSVYPGRYGFLATTASGVAIRELDLTAPPDGPIRFDLRPGAPLLVENNVGAGFVAMELKTASGVIVTRRGLTGTWSRKWNLPPGDYQLTTTDESGVLTRQRVSLTAAGATLSIPE